MQVLQGIAVKDEDQRRIDFLTKASQQVKKMNTLINGFLNSSRLESGKIQLDLKIFYLNQLINETIDDIKLTVRSHQITFSPCEPI
jgi:two-component system sensor histidine kinase VicK